MATVEDINISDIGDLSSRVIDDIDDTYEAVSRGEVVSRFRDIWMNEKLSPELLAHRPDFADGMIQIIEDYQEMMKLGTREDFRIPIHNLECDRMRYMVNDYLRCRLTKIEKFCLFLIRDPVEQKKLSDDELPFLQGLYAATQECLTQEAFSRMPENMRNQNLDKQEVRPNLYEYVLIRAKKTLTGVSIMEEGSNEEQIVDFDTGDQQLVPYKCIQALLEDESVHLI